MTHQAENLNNAIRHLAEIEMKAALKSYRPEIHEVGLLEIVRSAGGGNAFHNNPPSYYWDV